MVWDPHLQSTPAQGGGREHGLSGKTSNCTSDPVGPEAAFTPARARAPWKGAGAMRPRVQQTSPSGEAHRPAACLGVDRGAGEGSGEEA